MYYKIGRIFSFVVPKIKALPVGGAFLLSAVVKTRNANSEILITQNYIDEAVKAWKHQGAAVHYINSLELPNNEKSEILLAAAMRHKGRPPKSDPYI